jgi:hypothetical protein
VFWDTTACVIQRPEAHALAWHGRNCPKFIFRKALAGGPAVREAAER